MHIQLPSDHHGAHTHPEFPEIPIVTLVEGMHSYEVPADTPLGHCLWFHEQKLRITNKGHIRLGHFLELKAYAFINRAVLVELVPALPTLPDYAPPRAYADNYAWEMNMITNPLRGRWERAVRHGAIVHDGNHPYEIVQTHANAMEVCIKYEPLIHANTDISLPQEFVDAVEQLRVRVYTLNEVIDIGGGQKDLAFS